MLTHSRLLQLISLMHLVLLVMLHVMLILLILQLLLQLALAPGLSAGLVGGLAAGLTVAMLVCRHHLVAWSLRVMIVERHDLTQIKYVFHFDVPMRLTTFFVGDIQ